MLVVKPEAKAKGSPQRAQRGTGENREQACSTVCEGTIAGATCLELHRDWLAIGGGGFEELLLLEAEHPGHHVARELLMAML